MEMPFLFILSNPLRDGKAIEIQAVKLLDNVALFFLSFVSLLSMQCTSFSHSIEST